MFEGGTNFGFMNGQWTFYQILACEQALRGALAAGREKEGELATTSLEFELRLLFPFRSLSTELSDFRKSVQSRNKCECKQTLKNT